MRMRRKRHLDERLAKCAPVLLARDYLNADTLQAIQGRSHLLSFRDVFGNDNPVEVELGCGLGGFCIEYARRHPDVNVLAVEKISNVLVAAMERAMQENLPNLRFLNIPAECLQAYLPSGGVRRIHLNFSTPLPKAGYARQRLTHPRFLAIYRDVLASGGEIWQKTDSMHFFEYSLEQLSFAGFRLKNISLDLHNSCYMAENIVTEYEHNFAEKGMPIYRLEAEKI